MLVNHPSTARQLVSDRAQRLQAEAHAFRLARSAQGAVVETATTPAPASRRSWLRTVTRSIHPNHITPAP